MFTILDAEGEIIANDVSSALTISAIDGQANQVTGTNRITVQNGTATFTDITFFGQPGSHGDLFEVSCSSIQDPLTDSNGVILPGEVVTSSILPLNVKFRFCGSGEIEQEGKCVHCDYGTYSFT